MDKRIINQDVQDENENVLFKLADLDLDALLSQYITDSNYGEYVDYEIYKNYSLSRESWIDFIEVKVKPPGAKTPEDVICKYFGLIVLQGYLCSLDEINDPERLYFELYLEDILASSMIKSLKYDYLMMQKENSIKEDDNIEPNPVKESKEETIKEEKENPVINEEKPKENINKEKEEDTDGPSEITDKDIVNSSPPLSHYLI